MNIIISIVAIVLLTIIAVLMSKLFRKVVPTNMVHIVQQNKTTVAYGPNQNGNIYYKWPSWFPVIGISTTELPISNFNQSFSDYEAYDKDKVPFMLDLTAFFRISDPIKAAERISSIDDLKRQLDSILKGAVRKILASNDVNEIMTDRATFGTQFTQEVKDELSHWGIETVKSIELMDIRDAKGSTIISDIMAKKSSAISTQSRIEVAKNHQEAETAELESRTLVDLKEQETAELVGKRTAEKEQQIGIAKEVSLQAIKVAKAETELKEKAILEITMTRQAEITKKAAEIDAENKKSVTILAAKGEAEAIGIKATADAEQISKTGLAKAEVILAEGKSQAEAYKLAVKAMGDDNYPRLKMIEEISKSNMKLMPENVIIGGGEGSGNIAENFFTIATIEKLTGKSLNQKKE